MRLDDEQDRKLACVLAFEEAEHAARRRKGRAPPLTNWTLRDFVMCAMFFALGNIAYEVALWPLHSSFSVKYELRPETVRLP